ncbi:Salutaridine reductase-like protein [Drosera capensis]
MKTNFYGPKKLIEALLPLFRRSPTKSRILNISSRLGQLDRMRNPTIKVTLGDEENLTEKRIEGVVKKFLEQVNNGTWESGGWPETWTDYAVSKMALNAYSKLLARRIKDSNIVVNCFCPGFTQTSMTGGKGSRTADVAARIAASVVLAQPEQLQTGKFVMGNKLSLVSKF